MRPSGVQRIEKVFEAAREEGRVALIPYLVAGYPDLETTKQHVRDLAAGGADIIELGVPFSDPVADGPTIQAAITHSLGAGVRPVDCRRMVKELRGEGLETPILGMTYSNLVYPGGYDKAARAWRLAGFDGAIVPDIPLEESAQYRAAFDAEGLATILLAAPTTDDKRLARMGRASTGFLYLVAVYGTTGARADVAPETRKLLARVKKVKDRPPACVGFGVSRPRHVATLKKLGAEGVVVGSALVDKIRAGHSVKRYMQQLRKAC